VVGGRKTGAHPGENTMHLADVVNAPLTIDAFHATDPRELMQLLYTSGTTGDPKAIATRHARFINAGAAASLFGFRPGDRPYTGLSLTHANAQMVTLSAILHLGLRGVISRKFTKSRLWDITRRHGCTVFNLLGGMTVELFGEPVRANDSDNPVRLVISAGMPAVIWEEFRRRFGVEILEFYGAAEGGLTINPPGVGPVGSVGKPPPGIQVGILDAMGQPCAPGEIGEICFRRPGGEAPAVDYEGDSVASARKLAGGWLHMGDIGYLDNEGWLFFHHREGGGIRRNGEFIDSTATESAIARHPDVSDVFVYGVPAGSGVQGEKDLVAAVVSTNRAHFDPQRLFEHCRAVLERRFVPRYLQLVDEIPKTASQKPQERILFEAFSPDAANVYVEAPQLNALRCERR
jgi:crotonobetaine/carnitine-CoA ligase